MFKVHFYFYGGWNGKESRYYFAGGGGNFAYINFFLQISIVSPIAYLSQSFLFQGLSKEILYEIVHTKFISFLVGTLVMLSIKKLCALRKKKS